MDHHPHHQNHGRAPHPTAVSVTALVVVFAVVACAGAVAAIYAIVASGGQGAVGESASAPVTPEPSQQEQPGQGGPDGLPRTPRLGIEVVQSGTTVGVAADAGSGDSRTSQVALERLPFELRVPDLDEETPVRICAWTDDSVFSLDSDTELEDVLCMAPGTGAADTEYSSGILFLGTDRHNHLVGTRLRDTPDGARAAYYDTVHDARDRAVPIADWEDDLYLAVVVDRDADEAIGNSEYEYLALGFPAAP
ncbi:hypothetical protein [Nocardiopsis ansamitocini]|uniref:Uncharacterized protein n=1 Tax=Nocardiopsis ansamitocini TaxID=1670832 RepID=A0A9W6P7G7_9ACTN|nr:hypothetical protein [Nocardiopsis ansamitocini]GLU48536.1 hypothetical protein Nans01_28870 [Nocardiopsis ansamitocini]